MSEDGTGVKILEELIDSISGLKGIEDGDGVFIVIPSRFMKDASFPEAPEGFKKPSEQVTAFVEKLLQKKACNLYIIPPGNGEHDIPLELQSGKTILVMPVVFSPTAARCESVDCLYEEWLPVDPMGASCSDAHLDKAGCCGKRSSGLSKQARNCIECPLFPFAFVLVMQMNGIHDNDRLVLELARERALCSVERARIDQEAIKKRDLESTVSKLLDSMSGSMEFEKRMKILLDFVMGIVSADGGSIMLFQGLGEELRLNAWTSVPGSPGYEDPPGAVLSAASKVAQSGKPLFLRGDLEEEGVTASSITLPLMSRESVVGALHLSSVDPNRLLCMADMVVMEEIARMASMGIENAFLFARMEEKDKIHRMLLKKIINAQEDERKRIASDIHDDTIQALISSFYRMEGVEALIKSERNKEARQELDRTKLSLQRNITGMRKLLFDLRPSILDDAGFAPALENYLNRMEDDYGIRYFLYVDESLDRLKPEVEVTLFRLAQEVLTNVRKHARATEVVVKIIRRNGMIDLTIRDNGGGFNVDEVLNDKSFEEHFGLKSVIERAELAGGGVKIWAHPGEGTEVALTIPEQI